MTATSSPPIATRASAPLQARPTLDIRTYVFAALLLILALVVLYPLIQLVLFSFTISKFHEPTRYGLDAWIFALSDPGMLAALWNSVLVVAARQAIAFPAALLIAWLIARTDLPGAHWIEFLFWIAFFLPVVSVVQAWIMLTHPSYGLLNQLAMKLPFIETPPFNIYSFWGIVWVHIVHTTIALKVMLLTPAFRNLDASLEEASLTSGASSMRTLIRVTLPLLTPAIATMLMVSLIASFQSVEIEVLLGIPAKFFVFGSKIYDLVRIDPPYFPEATALGVLVMLAVLPFTFLHRWATNRRRFTTVTSQYKPHSMELGKWRWFAFAIVLFWGLLITVVPMVVLVVGTFMKLYGFLDVPGGAWTLAHWQRVLSDQVFVRSLTNGVYLALGSATLSVVFFTLLAYMIVRVRSRITAVADLLTWIPFALPGIIIVLAWLWIFLRIPLFTPLYGSIYGLILVSALSRVTVGAQFMKASVIQLGEELEEASYTVGGNWWTTFRRVVVPLLAPMMVALWVLSFVGAIGGSIVPLLLASPASRPLALLQFEYVAGGRGEAASVVGVILILLTVGVATVARAFGLRVGLSRL